MKPARDEATAPAERTVRTIAPHERLAVNLRELSVMVGVDEKTLRYWAREFGLPTYRIGRRVLVVVPEFLDWMRAHRDSPARDLDGEIATILGRLGTRPDERDGG